MSKDALLIELCQHMLREFELIPNWRKLIAVDKVGACHAGLSGYSFDTTGQWEAGSPDGFESLRALKKLCQSMAAESPTGRPWVSCLLRIGSNGEVGADFEYDDADRWAINPRNLEQRIAEFAAMPV
ncbi:hypothetical protein [Ottowia testudinis]|uniref:Uncharacterized protein n=1 Tax=Ottowia testudinis TaxID=2816950 RepID=A0A975H5Z7_9BURK|nr:hypothetical protein [Ottowia testudinis]QTD45482.1 hypothetical protein J1M35_00705 [Ottowia testudinis]